MAKGLKMFFARQSKNDDQLVSISAITKDSKDGLICEYCDANVIWVDSFVRLGRTISPYLRLGPNQEHSASCKNNVRTAVEALVAKSTNIEDTKDIFLSDQGTFTFRMNVLLEAESDFKRAKKAYEDECDSEVRERKNREYKASERRLSNYFNSAAGIAKIWERIEESSDKKLLSELVVIEFNGKKIKWNNFFYDESRYPILHKKGDGIEHPVAIAFTVKETSKHIDTDSSNFYTVKGDKCIVHSAEDQIIHYVPSLNAHTDDYFNNLQEGDELIIIGKPKCPRGEPWRHLIYKNLKFWVSNEKQLTKLSE